MARPQTPTTEALAKVDAILAGYQASGLTRRQYCQRVGIPLSTFDYYKRRARQLREREEAHPTASTATAPQRQRLVRVKIEKLTKIQTPLEATANKSAGFVLTLANSRRIESTWDFLEQNLLKLIRTVEAA
jgi:hypothetical protein